MVKYACLHECVCIYIYMYNIIVYILCSIDDEERKQHYFEIKADLDVAEENMDTLVRGVWLLMVLQPL